MTKIRALLAAISFLSLFGMSESAHAVVINFDDLASDTVTPIANGYQGFNWSNVYAFDPVAYGYSDTGYNNGTVSPLNVAYNGYGNLATISSDTAFTLNGGYFTSAWEVIDNVTINGYLDGALIYTETRTITDAAPLYIGLDWVGIDEFSFIGELSHVAFDDLRINESCEVPLPAALPLFASALGLMGFGVSRKRKA